MDEKISRSVRLTPDEWDYARTIGRGSVSHGIGTTLAYHKKRESKDSPVCTNCGLYSRMPKHTLCQACFDEAQKRAHRDAKERQMKESPTAAVVQLSEAIAPSDRIRVAGWLIEEPYEVPVGPDRDIARRLGLPMEMPLPTSPRYDAVFEKVNQVITDANAECNAAGV